MSSVVISGDSSGAITLAVPSAAGTNTATLPAATGTVMVSGNMPAFSAYASSGTSCANTVWTKIGLQAKEFDTASAFDATTNYRFTPLVAGYYQISGIVGWNSPVNQLGVAIYKNGGLFKYGYYNGNSGNTYVGTVSSLIYFNGSTDYVELYANQTSGSSQTCGTSATTTYFQGSLIRTA